MTKKDLQACEALLGYEFSDLELLRQALTHSSDKPTSQFDNERLEFLGDSILDLVAAEHLYRTRQHASEGELTQRKSRLVSRVTLARLARGMDLTDYLILGKGVRRQSASGAEGKRLPPSILAGALEAVIAAIYLDGGMAPARQFVLRMLAPEMERVESPEVRRNYKSLLQELAQLQMQSAPTYRVIATEGPDHQRRFKVVAVIGDQDYAKGEGRSKKEAEQDAAQKTYKLLARSDR